MGDEVKLFSGGELVSSATVLTGAVLAYRGNDSMSVESGGTANSTTVNNWGELYVYSGGTANNTTINANGQLNVSGGTANSTTVNGDMYVGKSSGTANSTTINSGGRLYVYSGGTANNVAWTPCVGKVYVADGAVVTYTSNYSGVYFGSDNNLLSSATEMSGTVISGWRCSMYVMSGGTANNTTVNSEGYLYVFSGGTANSTTVNSEGYLYVSGGGTANRTIVNAGGGLWVSGGGTANSTTINDGYLKISSGCTATAITASSGARLVLTVAPETYIQGTYNNSAFEMKNAYISGYTVNSGGWLCVESGGTANSTTVYSGYMDVYSGGTANSTTVNSGGQLYVSGGGRIGGTMQIASGAYVSAYAGAIIDFTVAEQSAPETTLINDWSLISGRTNASYTLTVNADQAAGTYALAGGAADFNSVITVKTVDEAELGTLAVDETKTFGTSSYTLAKNAGTLELTITSAATPLAKSDVDGNGISDVMFQYNVDHQIGFWMNGSSTWQGTGALQPSEWVLLGNYDMDSNSKADQVMFGNVLGGAYIGYYKDGDTTGSGWVTIGYLDNTENIKWDNVIGNLTGNEGKNSIVWHAPELNACGVWTDGTTDWVGISGSFDSNWEMQGCGDFDGNGKDEILWQCGGNLYTTDIDGNFASLGGASGWEVRAIGDFSGDGTDDIVLFHSETGSVMKYENGQASQWVSLGQLDYSDWFVVGAGDYNNDQIDDLLVRQYSTGMLGYYTSGDMSKWNELGRGVDMSWTVIA